MVIADIQKRDKGFCMDSQEHLTTKILGDMVPLWERCIKKNQKSHPRPHQTDSVDETVLQ